MDLKQNNQLPLKLDMVTLLLRETEDIARGGRDRSVGSWAVEPKQSSYVYGMIPRGQATLGDGRPYSGSFCWILVPN